MEVKALGQARTNKVTSRPKLLLTKNGGSIRNQSCFGEIKSSVPEEAANEINVAMHELVVASLGFLGREEQVAGGLT